MLRAWHPIETRGENMRFKKFASYATVLAASSSHRTADVKQRQPAIAPVTAPHFGALSV